MITTNLGSCLPPQQPSSLFPHPTGVRSHHWQAASAWPAAPPARCIRNAVTRHRCAVRRACAAFRSWRRAVPSSVVSGSTSRSSSSKHTLRDSGIPITPRRILQEGGRGLRVECQRMGAMGVSWCDRDVAVDMGSSARYSAYERGRCRRGLVLRGVSRLRYRLIYLLINILQR